MGLLPVYRRHAFEMNESYFSSESDENKQPVNSINLVKVLREGPEKIAYDKDVNVDNFEVLNQSHLRINFIQLQQFLVRFLEHFCLLFLSFLIQE